MSENQQKNLFMGSLISSVIGAALLIFGEFAGWYDYWYSGGHFYEWGYVYFISGEGGFGATILIGSFAAAHLYCVFVSYQGFTTKEQLSYSTVHRATLASLFAIVGITISGLIFVIAVSGNDDWWFSEGFYGGLIGALLTYLMFRKQEEYCLDAPAK
ncbi:MAG: hypothetical protein KAR35_01770 [Candidatus Heimdallarchaeota archaeon]|nr:hypothetical protein [Candidatus Heimdallarchaeota archaeon]MCK5048080.1 hypothetical protein [Candidatus Heimdallarchaeota archaeon]